MKIWVIGRGYPTPENKMWGVFELEQAKLLARAGHNVTYLALTLSFFSRKDPRGMRVFEVDGVKVYACSRLYFPGKLGLAWESYEDKCWRDIFERALEDGGIPEALHVHYPAMIGNICEVDKLRKQGVRLFSTEHWSRVMLSTLSKYEMKRLSYYTAYTDGFFCVSESLLNAARDLVEIKAPTTVIPNIVSDIFFEKKNCSSDDVFTFVGVGRLVPLKQFDMVIAAFEREFLPEEKVALTIVGSGPERANLEGLAKNDARISFMGALPLDHVADVVAASDALVSFSRYETFAVPVTEALACGKPVIVSESSGVSSYIDDLLGLTVPCDNAEMLARAMRDLYANRSRYRAEGISIFAREHFGDEVILHQLEAAYGCASVEGVTH
jgi:L-malate glycosyltransferase